MNRLLVVIAVVSVVGASALAVAFGQETTGGHPVPSEGMMGRMGEMGGMSGVTGMPSGGDSAERPWVSLALQNRKQLGLSADQAKTLESIRSDFQKEATRRSADIQITEMELAELLRAEPVDLSKVEAKLRQIEGLRTAIRLSRIKTLEKGKAILTPEQRKKLDTLSLQASADVHGGMMGGRGMEEMQRFMQSDRMPQAMTGMMEMARQMGNGDPMAGMVRMMEMMSMMGQMGGMMNPVRPSR